MASLVAAADAAAERSVCNPFEEALERLPRSESDRLGSEPLPPNKPILPSTSARMEPLR